MKIRVLSVAEPKNGERLSFEFVNEHNQGGCCYPSLGFLQGNPDFSVKSGDELLVGDFIPDLVTGAIMPVLFPESIQKLGASSN